MHQLLTVYSPPTPPLQDRPRGSTHDRRQHSTLEGGAVRLRPAVQVGSQGAQPCDIMDHANSSAARHRCRTGSTRPWRVKASAAAAPPRSAAATLLATSPAATASSCLPSLFRECCQCFAKLLVLSKGVCACCSHAAAGAQQQQAAGSRQQAAVAAAHRPVLLLADQCRLAAPFAGTHTVSAQ